MGVDEEVQKGGFRCFRAETFIVPILLGAAIGLAISFFGSKHDPGDADADAERLLAAEQVVFIRRLAPPDTGVLEYELDAAERESLAAMMRSIRGDHWPCQSPWGDAGQRIVVDGSAGEWGYFTNRAEVALNRVHPEIPDAARLLRAAEQFRVWDGTEDSVERARLKDAVLTEVAAALLPGSATDSFTEEDLRGYVELVEGGDAKFAWSDGDGQFARRAGDRPLFSRFTVTNPPEVKIEGPPKPEHE